MLYAHMGPFPTPISPWCLFAASSNHSETYWALQREGGENIYKMIGRSAIVGMNRAPGQLRFFMTRDQVGKIRSASEMTGNFHESQLQAPVQIVDVQETWAHSGERSLTYAGSDTSANIFLSAPAIGSADFMSFIRYREASYKLAHWLEWLNAGAADLRPTLGTLRGLVGNDDLTINDVHVHAQRTGLFSRVRKGINLETRARDHGGHVHAMFHGERPNPDHLFPGYACMWVARGWGAQPRPQPWSDTPVLSLVPPLGQPESPPLQYFQEEALDMLRRWFEWDYANTLRLVATTGHYPLPELRPQVNALRTLFPTLFDAETQRVSYVGRRQRRRAVR